MEKEKRENYQDLDRELQKTWNVGGQVIPSVTSLLGTKPQQFWIILKRIKQK